jgi:hypothetical protein
LKKRITVQRRGMLGIWFRSESASGNQGTLFMGEKLPGARVTEVNPVG